MRSIICLLAVFSSFTVAGAAERVIFVSSIIPAAEMAHRAAELPAWDATLHHYVVGPVRGRADCRGPVSDPSAEAGKAAGVGENRRHPCSGI
ncbi:MAG: hypothetical protein KGI75_23785 [Rhizobiaceae bacterium]|nr:hypothetical protein [Rhizobiaceae bacterium]